MADKKISALTAATTPLAGTEVLPIVQGASTVKASVVDVLGPLSSVSGLTAGYILKGNGTSNVTASIAYDSGSAFGIGTNSFTNTVNTAIVRQSGTGVDLGGSATTAAIRIRGGSSGAGLIDFYPVSSDPNSAPYFSGRIFYDHGVNSLAFSANGIEAIKLTSAGNVNISTGNVVMATAGKGIDFSANTHAAGMTSELLNWYEEGTFTPVFAGLTVGNGSVFGYYRRIGKQVFITYGFILGSTSVVAALTGISGLPFTTGTVGGSRFFPVTGVAFEGGVGWYGATSAIFSAATSGIGVFSPTNNVGFSAAVPFVWGTDDSLSLTATYFVD
jgi:hypothetical protein